jgi:hypothetical protein
MVISGATSPVTEDPLAASSDKDDNSNAIKIFNIISP